MLCMCMAEGGNLWINYRLSYFNILSRSLWISYGIFTKQFYDIMMLSEIKELLYLLSYEATYIPVIDIDLSKCMRETQQLL